MDTKNYTLKFDSHDALTSDLRTIGVKRYAVSDDTTATAQLTYQQLVDLSDLDGFDSYKLAAAVSLGSMTSERKAEASRANGRKGGRPKKSA